MFVAPSPRQAVLTYIYVGSVHAAAPSVNMGSCRIRMVMGMI